METLASNISKFLSSVTENLFPLSEGDCFVPEESIAEGWLVADRFIIRVEEVGKIPLKIKLDKAMGPDYIPNWIFQDCPWILAPPVCSIYNSSLREGFVPTIWKSADVCPIPKINPPTRFDKGLSSRYL